MDLKFIKIPKTGSTFFEKNFHGRFTRKNDVDVKVYSVGHSWVYSTKIKGWLDWDYPNQKQQIFRDVMVFNLNPSDRIVTLVRNPFEILFSYFNYDWADCRKSHGLLVGGLYTKEDFQKFVDIYLDDNIEFHAPAFKKSLFSQLKDKDGNWIIDESSIILKFENLNNDIDKFSKNYGFDIIDSSNTAKNEAKHNKPCKWYEAYRPDQIEKLNVLWSEDLEYFNYSFPSNQNKKMKVALCFSGQLRDLHETKNFWTELIKKYDIDVYASFWDIENKELGDTIKEFEQIYNPKRLEIERYDIFKSTTQNIASSYIESPTGIAPQFQQSSKDFGQLSMYYKIWRANLLSKQLDIEYDVVIRARIDTVLDENFEIQKNNYLNLPIGIGNAVAFPNSDGFNDCFAYGTPKIMDYYSFVFLQAMEYLSKGHYLFPPEHVLLVHFSKVHIPVRFFKNYMMISRKWKGTPNEMYNGWTQNLDEFISWSDSKQFLPSPEFTFRKETPDLNFEDL